MGRPIYFTQNENWKLDIRYFQSQSISALNLDWAILYVYGMWQVAVWRVDFNLLHCSLQLYLKTPAILFGAWLDFELHFSF